MGKEFEKEEIRVYIKYCNSQKKDMNIFGGPLFILPHKLEDG